MVALVTAACMGVPALWIHILGATFTLGRILHAIGLSRTILQARAAGMLLTWIPFVGIAGMLIYHGLA